MAPVFIETPEDFRRLVRRRETTESLYLEFKVDLDAFRARDDRHRREGQREFCRDVSAFANAWGGCLLVGVEEGGPHQAAKVATDVRGIDDFDGRRAWMEAAMRNFLVPSEFGLGIQRIHDDGRTVIAVNIPASDRLILVWDSEDRRIECFRRTNEGKGERLHPDQMEAHAMNARRSSAIMLRRVLRETSKTAGRWQVDLASGAWQPGSASDPPSYLPAQVTLNESLIGEHDFGLLIQPTNRPAEPGPVVRIPYGLLREAWTTTDQHVGLYLHVRVMFRKATVSLEPF